MSALYYGITQLVRWQHTPDLKRVSRWNVQSILRFVVCRGCTLLTLKEEEVLRAGVASFSQQRNPFYLRSTLGARSALHCASESHMAKRSPWANLC